MNVASVITQAAPPGAFLGPALKAGCAGCFRAHSDQRVF